jgi:hypothetical protein
MKKYSDINENKYLLLTQEGLYCCSNLLTYKWYRKLFGGKWRLIKFGKDTPDIHLFAAWSKMPDECFDGYIKIFEEEEYKITNVDTKWKMIKQFFKNLIT